MSSIYLIDLTKFAIVGKFESVTDAEIAGELLLGTAPYRVDDEGTLRMLGREELRQILTALGRTVSGNLAKAEFITKIVELAEATEFAPIVPPAPEKAHKAPKGAGGKPRAEGVCGKLWAMYDAAQAGGDLNRKACLEQAAAAGINPATAKTQWQRWRTARGLV